MSLILMLFGLASPVFANSIVAEEVFKTFRVEATSKDLNGLADRITCDGPVTLRKLNTLKPKVGYHQGKVKVSSQVPSDDQIFFDFSDGDQVEGYVFRRSDLVALQKGELASISVLILGGYWYSDGDHYTDSVGECTK